METFRTDEELLQWVMEQKQADLPVKQAWQREIAVDMSYYEGYGWTQLSPFSTDSIERLKVDLNPDSPEFRATLNRTTPLVQRAAATTHPTTITVRGTPPERNLGPAGTVKAQLHEDLANLLVTESGFINAWQDANFLRHVIGCYGVGLSLRPGMRSLAAEGGEVAAPSNSLKAFAFLPLKLILDPGVQERDLSQHDWVIYSDVWSYTKVRRIFGAMLDAAKITIDQSRLRQMGDLNSFEVTLNNLTYNRLFPHFRAHSKTKGLIVTQVHRKDASGRFSTMEVLLEIEPGKPVLINKDARQTPFGGNGLPLRLLHGHRRADAMYSIGDTRMCKDDQDRLNRTQTCHDRQMVHSSRYRWVVDKAGIPGAKSEKEVAKRFTNAEGGIVVWESGPKERPNMAPHIAQVPPPNPGLRDMIAEYSDAMRQQVHRSASNFGEMLSHVPNASYQRGLDESGAVFDTWVSEDKGTMEAMIGVMVGTAQMLVRDRDAGMLGTLDLAQFSGEEMLALSQEDPRYAGCDLSISDGSIRMRSWNARKQDLEGAAQKNLIDPKTFRREMADSLDSPLVLDDKLFGIAFDKIALGVLAGAEPFEPLPLGPDRAADLLNALERAMVAPEAMRDPSARLRVAQAIQSQRMMMAQMTAAEQQVAGGQGVGVGAQASQDTGAAGDMPDVGAFSALVDQMSGLAMAA